MTMPAQELETLYAYLDNELSAADRRAFAARVATDPPLAAAVDVERRLQAEFRIRMTQPRAPAALRAKVHAVLRLAPSPSRWQRWRAWWSTPQPIRPLVGVAYTLLWVLVLGGAIWWPTQPAAQATDAVNSLLQRHEIYFENQPVLDITGTAAQIRTWFADRVPYPINAPVLSDDWQLTGARLDEFQQQRTAHILYMRGNGQRTSLTIFPLHALPFPARNAVRFAGQAFWTRNDGIHWAILWRTIKNDYALIGDIEVPLDDLLALAVEARRQLP